jgi:sulfatase maturation enzyme AslB (radical SAM superfamily)
MSKTYCPYPFIGASLQADGVVLPCGQYMNEQPLKKLIIPIEDIRQGSHLTEMRRKMLTDQHDSGCQCPVEEQSGLPSMRQAALKKYGVQPFGKLKTVEIFFDNVCNLKCRMCSSSYSHLMFDDEKELYGITFSDTKYNRNKRYKEIDVSELEEIKVYGGEPLINVEANEFFGRLLDDGNIENLTIEVSTNVTTLPMPNVEEAFLKCKYLNLNLSIDGYGKLNEFIRSGSNFDQTIKNLKYFHNLIDLRNNNVSIRVHSVVSVYNINLLVVLQNYIRNTFPKFSLNTQILQFPEFMSIKNMPDEYKKQIPRDGLEQGVLSYLDNPSEKGYFDHFVNFHNKMNGIRKEELGDINPLLDDYLKNYKVTHDSKEFYIGMISRLKGLEPI